MSDEYQLTAPGLIGSARLGLPKGPLRPYGSVGVGFVYAELSRSGSTFGIPGEISEHDFAPGLSAAVGVDIKAGSRSFLMIEYRRLFVDADFEDLSGGDVDVGGALVLLGYRRGF